MSTVPDLIVRRGDDLPALELTLTDGLAGDPVDLTTATRVRLLGKRGAVTVVDVDLAARPDDGTLTRTWAGTETDTLGRLLIVVQVTWPGGAVQTFPGSSEFLTVDIVRNLP